MPIGEYEEFMLRKSYLGPGAWGLWYLMVENTEYGVYCKDFCKGIYSELFL